MSTINPAKRILIVDHWVQFRTLLENKLQAAGYATSAVANGKEALGFRDGRNGPLAIILSLKMPVMDGWEFLKRQSESRILASVPVILCCADGNISEKDFRGTQVVAVVNKTEALRTLVPLLEDILLREAQMQSV